MGEPKLLGKLAGVPSNREFERPAKRMFNHDVVQRDGVAFAIDPTMPVLVEPPPQRFAKKLFDRKDADNITEHTYTKAQNHRGNVNTLVGGGDNMR